MVAVFTTNYLEKIFAYVLYFVVNVQVIDKLSCIELLWSIIFKRIFRFFEVHTLVFKANTAVGWLIKKN